MDKNTLSNYGWIVIAVLVLSVMIALATPFGKYIENGVRSTTAGLFETSEKAMNVVGMSAGNGSFDDGDSGTQTPEYDHNAPELHPGKNNKTIPEGAYYGVLNIEKGMATGEVEFIWYATMPATVNDGDIYLYGDYMYMYSLDDGGWHVYLATEAYEDAGIYPTEFEYTDSYQTTYGAILESINGKPVTSMTSTFFFCTSLTTAPEIPSSVTNMDRTFQDCHALTTAPAIPSGVTNMYSTFMSCYSLTIAPKIPSSVTNISACFSDCRSLTGEISIPCSFASEEYINEYCPATITYYHIDDCDGSCGK